MTVASRIYALFVAKSTSVQKLGVGGVKPIWAMPRFQKRLFLNVLPGVVIGDSSASKHFEISYRTVALDEVWTESSVLQYSLIQGKASNNKNMWKKSGLLPKNMSTRQQ